MIWYYLFFAALAVLVIRQRQRMKRADQQKQQQPEPDSPASARRRDLRTITAITALESDLLQPEPQAPRAAPAQPRPSPSRPEPATRVEESISVVLRRQIPPRDEAPRSWLGGLPMLPDGIEWPRGVNPEKRGEGEVPLHFIAQIACADLPPELWGGLGPRAGWLRLFLNGNSCDNEDRGLWRLVHSAELGSERQPPADIGVIHDGMYTGGAAWTQSKSVYPRWPVDLVKVGNTLRHEGQRSWPTPDEFETEIYPGQPIERDRHKVPKLPPFARGVLQTALRETIALMRLPVREYPLSDVNRTQLASPTNWPLILTVPTERLARANTRWLAEEAERRGVEALSDAEQQAYLASQPNRVRAAAELDTLRTLIGECPSPEALIARCEAGRAEWLAWRGEVADWLEEWLNGIAAATLDQPLTADDRERMAMLEGAPPHVYWVIDRQGGYSDEPNYVGPRKIESSAFAQLAEQCHRAASDLAVEFYLDPQRRHLLPAEYLPACEAWWRALYNNRPHRMGGYHDGVQSDAIEGPQEKLLLLQLATDDPMQFCWGDCGAIYAFIRTDDLKAGRFDAAELHLECH